MSDQTRAHDWDRFARWDPPPLMATSNAPKPYKPPVAWTLTLFSAAIVGMLAFVAVMAAVW